MNTRPAIASIGAPPAQHADRVVADMVRWLDTQISDHMKALSKPKPIGGSLKGQARGIARLTKALGPALIFAAHQPGTRGRWVLHVCIWRPIPETGKPWIMLDIVTLDGRQQRSKTGNFLAISHHALSRLAQRAGVRTVEDLHAATWRLAMALYDAIGPDLKTMPPEGRRIEFDAGSTTMLAVIGHHQEGGWLVRTVLPPSCLEGGQ